MGSIREGRVGWGGVPIRLLVLLWDHSWVPSKGMDNCPTAVMLNSLSFPFGATWYFLWPRWPSLGTLWALSRLRRRDSGSWPRVDGTLEVGGNFQRAQASPSTPGISHVLGTRRPRTAVSTVGPCLTWLGTCLYQPQGGRTEVALALLSRVASRIPLPRKLSGAFVSHVRGVSWMQSGLGSQGPRLRGVAGASDVTQSLWGVVLLSMDTAPLPAPPLPTPHRQSGRAMGLGG